MIKRYLKESMVLGKLTFNQLNSEKNKIKPPLENLHPLELIKYCHMELEELKAEFETEQEIDFKRVSEEIGDVGAYLSGIIAWARKDLKNESVG